MVARTMTTTMTVAVEMATKIMSATVMVGGTVNNQLKAAAEEMAAAATTGMASERVTVTATR